MRIVASRKNLGYSLNRTWVLSRFCNVVEGMDDEGVSVSDLADGGSDRCRVLAFSILVENGTGGCPPTGVVDLIFPTPLTYAKQSAPETRLRYSAVRQQPAKGGRRGVLHKVASC